MIHVFVDKIFGSLSYNDSQIFVEPVYIGIFLTIDTYLSF